MLDATIKTHLENLLVEIDKSELLKALNNANSNEELTSSWLPIFININANYAQIVQRNQVTALNSVIEYFQTKLSGKFEENSALAKEFESLLAKHSSTADNKEDMFILEMVARDEDDELESKNLVKPQFASFKAFSQKLLEQFNKLYPHQKDQTLQSPDFIESLRKNFPQLDLSKGKISSDTISEASNRCTAQIIKARNNALLSQLSNQKASLFVMQAIDAYWHIITSAYGSHEATASLYGTNGVNKIMSYCNAAQIELLDILSHPAAEFYLTSVSIKDVKFEPDISIDTDPDIQIFDCEDKEILNAEKLEISLSNIICPQDYKIILRSARSLLMVGAKIYARMANTQDGNQEFNEAAKNQLRALLNNPYVQSIKDTIPNLSASQAEELFKRPEPVAGEPLAFSKEFNEMLSGVISAPGSHPPAGKSQDQTRSSSPKAIINS